MQDDEHQSDVNPADEAASQSGPSDASGMASPSDPHLVSSVRIVYCTSCGCQLQGLHIGEPCPNCQVPVGSAAKGTSKTNGKAITALVLGICSFVGCMFYGLPGIACGILAIVFAGQVRRGVASGEINASSLGMANAGRVCGIVGLCLSIFCVLAMAAWFVFVFSFMVPQQQQMQQNMNQQLQQQMNQQLQQSQPSFSVPVQPNPADHPDITEPETPATNP